MTPTPEALDALAKEEFCARFKARLIARAGKILSDGMNVEEYADMVFSTYWDEPEQRAEGPEACAEADMSYWGED